uniref:Uncharacterized protein n=1 Tax=Oryza brachyantha TaxID=4533 RepID=J3LGZ2_ORYBR
MKLDGENQHGPSYALQLAESSAQVDKRSSGAEEQRSGKEEKLVPVPVVELPLRELLATCAERDADSCHNPHRRLRATHA